MPKAETELLLSSPVGAEVLMYGRVRGDCHPADTVQAKLVSRFIEKQWALPGKGWESTSFKVLLLPISQVKSTLC